MLKNNRNVNRIQFYDDTFTLDKSRVREICAFMKSLYVEYGIMWVCEIHCQTIYECPEIIKTMVESGLISAQIGLESGNNKILERLNKKTTLDMITKTIEICREAGLYSLQGNLIIGAAGETEEDIQCNYDFAKKIIELGMGMFELEVAMYWPFKNTPIALNPKLYGIEIIPEQYEYSIHCMGNMVSRTEALSREKLVEHFYKLKETINQTYKDLCIKLDHRSIEKHWINGQFNLKSAWGRALGTYDHLNSYFKAKELVSNNIENSCLYPIRTFENLCYEKKLIYLPNTPIKLDFTESRIIELCNGRTTIVEIADKLNIEYNTIIKILGNLEDRMLVFISNV